MDLYGPPMDPTVIKVTHPLCMDTDQKGNRGRGGGAMAHNRYTLLSWFAVFLIFLNHALLAVTIAFGYGAKDLGGHRNNPAIGTSKFAAYCNVTLATPTEFVTFGFIPSSANLTALGALTALETHAVATENRSQYEHFGLAAFVTGIIALVGAFLMLLIVLAMIRRKYTQTEAWNYVKFFLAGETAVIAVAVFSTAFVFGDFDASRAVKITCDGSVDPDAVIFASRDNKEDGTSAWAVNNAHIGFAVSVSALVNHLIIGLIMTYTAKQLASRDPRAYQKLEEGIEMTTTHEDGGIAIHDMNPFQVAAIVDMHEHNMQVSRIVAAYQDPQRFGMRRDVENQGLQYRDALDDFGPGAASPPQQQQRPRRQTRVATNSGLGMYRPLRVVHRS